MMNNIGPNKGRKKKGGVTTQTLKEDGPRSSAGAKRDRTITNLSGYAAPRVGGAVESTGMAKGTTKKADIKKSIKRIKNTSASPQAKAAAKRNLKRKY